MNKQSKTSEVIVAGAGIWGCTVARLLAESGKRVIVLESRKSVGGNCRCKTMNGIEVHLYGSHIFHTSDKAVWEFLNRFTSFNDYRHSVLACTRKSGKNGTTDQSEHLYHLPIGCTLLKEFFGRDLKPSEMTDAEREQLFDAFIRGYTSKQWGVPPEKVDPSVIARLKVRDSLSTDYFDDPYQGIPADGYNELFRKLLDHPNITVHCNRTFELSDHLPATSVFYSGPIDRLFDYRHGCLPWRSLRFETEHLQRRSFQDATVVNYPDLEQPFTRIHEFRKYHPEAKGAFAKPEGTIITREYPCDWRRGLEPYYPIANGDSAALLKKYQEEVESLNRRAASSGFRLIVGGRLGEYRYFDMDKSVAAAMACVKNSR